MGNQNSQQTKNLQFHFKFKNIQIISTNNVKQQMIVTLHIPENVGYSNWRTQYNQFVSIQNQSKRFLFLPQQISIKTQQKVWCNQVQSIQLRYKYYQQSFHHEIKRRSQKAQHFTETFLLYLLFNMLKSVAQFQIRQKRFGDIRPKNILMNNLSSLKLINRMSFPGADTGFEKFINHVKDDGKFYLAPQQIKLIKNPSQYRKLIPGKSEAFSIGLTIIEALSLQSCQHLYSTSFEYFDQVLLSLKIQKIKQTCSKLLFKLLESLVTMDQNKRPSCRQVLETLYPYEKQINQMQQFFKSINTNNKQQQSRQFTKLQVNHKNVILL